MSKTTKGAKRETIVTSQVYTFSRLKFYLVLGVCVVVGFLLLQPSMAASLLSRQRQATLHSFLHEVQTHQQLDPQAFWKFREFYSPGEFKINPQAVSVFQTFRIIALPAPETPLLYFSAVHTQSTDSVITDSSLYQTKIAEIPDPLFQNQNSVIYYSAPDTLHILFYTSIDDMKKTIGFFDFLPEEMELLNGKYWLNETELKVP